MDRSFFSSDYLPILIQSVVAFSFVAITMTVTHYIGGKRKKIHTLRKEENFECGIEVKGNARFPFSVQYFLIEFGWEGFFEMLLFLGFLLFGFYYIIRKKALDWD
jgi:NADH-quinone oxidoreductase subunit A